MGRKPQRSLAQIKQVEDITLRRTRLHPDSLLIVLADARTHIRRISQLAKQAHNDSKRDLRNARKRELRAVKRADFANAEIKDLQAQVTELTAIAETERRDAVRVAEGLEERNSGMKKKLRRFREQLSQEPSRLERAIQKVLKEEGRTSANAGSHRIKSAAGVVEDWARDLIRSLVIKAGVPVMKVPAVFLLVTRALGVDIEDTVSDRTCRRIVLEGGVLAKTWLVKEINESASESYRLNEYIPRANAPVGLTISGDATTLRAISYESRHSTLLLPTQPRDNPPTGETVETTSLPEKRDNGESGLTHDGDLDHQPAKTLEGGARSAEQEDHTMALLNAAKQRGVQSGGSDTTTPTSAPLKPAIRSFGTWSTVDHKSETQLQGWKDIVDDMFSTFKRSPMGSSSSANPLEFAQKVTGICSDHAADQKKTARLVKEWKQDADRELRGEKEMLARGEAEIIGAVVKAWDEMLAEVGGLGSWELLSKERQDELLRGMVRKVQVTFGEEAYEKLTPTEKRRADLFIWTGCAMHKDLNATKGGAEAMAAGWEGEAPVKLMNKHNVAVTATGSIVLGKQAADDSEGGAVKLTKLVGALVRHNDAKKGHQDMFRIFCLGRLGHEIYFPDTSNIRYQSHCDAAIEICIHHNLYSDFIDPFVRNSKERPGLNNLENNVLIGLNDIPTMTEACVLGLYAQAISHPYMRRVRVPETHIVNHLDLGPFHNHLLGHLRKVIDNSDLLLGPQVSSVTGSLDGQSWESPGFMDYISTHQEKYPCLRRALIGFFKGALETWERFTPEFREDSDAMNTTNEEKLLAFRSPTNDINESQLGIKRQMARRAPNMTEHQFNARLIFGRNNVDDVSDFLSVELRQFARGEARRIDRSKAHQTQRQKLATASIDASNQRQRKQEASQQLAAERLERLKASNPILDLEKLRGTPYSDLRVDRLKEQLRWHRQVDGDEEIPKAISGLRKSDLLKEVLAAVGRWTQRNIAGGTSFVSCVAGIHLI